MRIAIRFDIGGVVGRGHMHRCLTLAKHLEAFSETIFLCRGRGGIDVEKLFATGNSIIDLDKYSEVTNVDAHGDNYSSWVGCSEEEDARTCIHALKMIDNQTIDWVIVDHYGLGRIWEDCIADELAHLGTKPKIMAIDDLANRMHSCNVLLDQNYYGDFSWHRYKGLVNEDCKLFLGPHYALLQDVYRDLQVSVPNRSSLKRVLIFFGSANCKDIMEDAVSALEEEDLKYLEFDVVVDDEETRKDWLERLSQMRSRTSVYKSLPTLSSLIVRADLAIGAGGIHTYERIILGLPAIVFPTAANQKEALGFLYENRCIYRADRKSIGSMIRYIRDNYEEVQAVLLESKAAMKCDASGLVTLIAVIKGEH